MVKPPIVVDSNPKDWAFDIPLSNNWSWFMVEIYFDQALQPSTIISSNVKFQDEFGNPINYTWLTYTWVEWQFFKLYFNTENPLEYGKNYIVKLSNNIKSEKWLWLVGNIPQAERIWHTIKFSTMKNYDSDLNTFIQWFSIEKTDPFWWAFDVPYDAKMRVIFNDTIDKTTITNSNIVLNKLNWSGNIILTWNLSFSYDNDLSPKILFISGNNYQNHKYRLTIKSSVKSLKWQTLWHDHIIEFDIGNKSASQIPLQIIWDWAEPDLSMIEINFSSPIDSSTINSQNVSLYSSWIKINTEVKYNYWWNSIIIKPNSALSLWAIYEVVLDQSNIKDIWWNSISWTLANNFNGFTYDPTQNIIKKSYTTISSNNFFVENLFAWENKLEIDFSKDIKEPYSKWNYSISYCSGNIDFINPWSCEFVDINISDTIINYDPIKLKTTIQWLNLTGLVKVWLSNIQSNIWSNLINWTWNDLFYIPVFQENLWTSFNWWNLAISLNANVNPQNNMAWKTSLYFIEFPISKQLMNWDKVEITFPSKFNLSSALLDSWNIINYVDWDFSKPKFIVEVNTWKNMLIYTISSYYTLNSTDYIVSGIKWITNPDQAKDYTTDWYIIEFTTKNSAWVVLDRFQSNPVYIQSAPTWDNAKTITIQLKDSNWNLALQNAVLHLNSTEWYNELLTDSNWKIVFTWNLNSYYGIFIDPFTKIKSWSNYLESDYISDGKYYDIYLNDNKIIDILLKNKNTNTDLITLNGTINWLNGKNVTIWVSSMQWYFEKNLWILNSDNFIYSLKIPKNIWYVNIWIYPSIPKDFQTIWWINTIYNFDWQAPKSKKLEIKDSNITGVNFIVQASNIDFTVTVVDNNWKVIPKANVYVYSPSSNMVWLFGSTDINWQRTFKVLKWTYTYGAYIEWLSTPVEQVANISSTYNGTLTVISPDKSIEWKVLNSKTPLSNVNVYAYNTTNYKWLNTMTDSKWNYKFYVEDWTWKIWGYVDTYWPLEEQTFIVSGSSLNNKIFVINIDNLHKISGNVTLSSYWVEWVNINGQLIEIIQSDDLLLLILTENIH